MDFDTVMTRLENRRNTKSVEGMSRVGISPDKAFGVSIPHLRQLAKEIKKDRTLAGRLWDAGFRETMILASMIDDPKALTEEQMETWAIGFYDWEVCDQTCANLFEKTPFAWPKAVEWSEREEEFVKRAGFVLMARLAVSDKGAPDEAFYPFFPAIVRESSDGRNMVKKAVNWAVRQIGKRNLSLNERAVEVARTIQKQGTKSGLWIASDAIRELTGRPVLARLEKRANK